LGGFSPTIIYALGGAELLLLIGFVIGVAPRLTYGLVLLLHAVSTFSAFRLFSSVRGTEHFVLCGLADAWRLFRTLSPARS
jgi:hypothetical protein